MKGDEGGERKYGKRHGDQWHRIEKPEINPRVYDQINFNKRAKNIP